MVFNIVTCPVIRELKFPFEIYSSLLKEEVSHCVLWDYPDWPNRSHAVISPLSSLYVAKQNSDVALHRTLEFFFILVMSFQWLNIKCVIQKAFTNPLNSLLWYWDTYINSASYSSSWWLLLCRSDIHCLTNICYMMKVNLMDLTCQEHQVIFHTKMTRIVFLWQLCTFSLPKNYKKY